MKKEGIGMNNEYNGLRNGDVIRRLCIAKSMMSELVNHNEKITSDKLRENKYMFKAVVLDVMLSFEFVNQCKEFIERNYPENSVTLNWALTRQARNIIAHNHRRPYTPEDIMGILNNLIYPSIIQIHSIITLIINERDEFGNLSIGLRK